MKTLSLLSIAFFLITGIKSSFAQEAATSQSASAQEVTEVPKVQTIEFKVEGVCKMCKTRIENAALIKGVKFAEWTKDTRMIKVVFKTAKTDEMSIHKAIAKAGHSTSKVEVTDDDYNKLPGCCGYNSGVDTH